MECLWVRDVHKNNQAGVMSTVMVDIIQACQDDKAEGGNKCSNDRAYGQNLLRSRVIAHQAPAVSKPALGDEGQGKGHYSNAASSNEERLEFVSSNV